MTIPTPLSLDGLPESPRAAPGRAIVILCTPQDELRIRARGSEEKVLYASSPTDLADLLSGAERPLVLLHANVFRDLDVKSASRMQDHPCRPVVAVIGGKDRMGYAFGTARQLGLGFIFPEDCVQHPAELRKWAQWMSGSAPGPGISDHLQPGAETHSIPVRRREDKPAAIAEILGFVGKIREDQKFLFELRLILEETINNAIFHAFWDGEGKERYSIDNFQAIGVDEAVTLDYGSDAATIAISVTDNQGRLGRDTILEKIQRQLNTQGIFDQSGRGIFLVYSLSGKLLFHLAPEKMTQIVALFSIAPERWPDSSPLKPILIFP